MNKWAWITLGALPWAVLALPQSARTQGAPAKKPTYADIDAIMKAHCTSCHSGSNKMGGLNLASMAGFKKGGINGFPIVVGNPAKSLLLERIKGHGGKPRMPMGFAPLSAAQTKTIEDWITNGASFAAPPKPHWAYLKPVRPTTPIVKQASWVRNPIDAFILARLEKGGIKPAPAASREALLRRVTLDLIGIPPTPAEIDAFVADKSPDAYEKVVDRLLANPHYGERQARMWLDLSRYADSDGYEKDLRRTIWKYRDWLIDALNRNEPYDKFTIDQLAGDLLSKPTQDQLIATGFNRNTQMNLEGGVDQEEAHWKVVLDRVGTTSTVWLGSTLQCAQCHDHKYDPFSQRDFYRMAAFFSNAEVYPQGPKEAGEEKWFEAQTEVPTPEQVAKRKELQAEVARLDGVLTAHSPEVDAEYAAWAGKIGLPWTTFSGQATTQSGSKIVATAAKGFLVSGEVPMRDTYTVHGKAKLDGVTALRIEALTDPSLPSQGPGRAGNGNFVLTRAILKVDGKPVTFRTGAADFVQNEFDAASVGGDKGPGWAVNNGTGRSHELVLELTAPLTTDGEAPVEIVLEQQSPHTTHTLGAFRLSFTSSAGAVASVVSPELRNLLAKAPRTPAEETQVRNRFAEGSTTLRPTREARAKAVMALNALQSQIPTTLVMRDKPAKGPLTALIRTRGDFMSPADKVTVGTPRIMPPMAKTMPGNRLGLAEWLVSKDNPLTARVQVNRMWEATFGRGLVETSEDFGTQGSRPTHPELLDWLATEFMARNWDMKAIHRLIVTSATYRQTSSISPALLKRDPENIFLARGPRFRLDAEAIRDSALAVAGLLDPKIGGPSVFPFQPEGTWDTPYNGEAWNSSMGGDAHRRGIYTFWKRTATYPGFMAFDATSRENCTVRRIRTNTPLQALAQLNDLGLFDAARALARRMQKEGGANDQTRLAYGFRLCTGRRPQADELASLTKLVNKLRDKYTKNADGAKKVGGDPALAAYTMAANVLLNLDEAMTKG